MMKKRVRVALVLALCTMLQLFGTAVLAADEPDLLPQDRAQLLEGASQGVDTGAEPEMGPAQPVQVAELEAEDAEPAAEVAGLQAEVAEPVAELAGLEAESAGPAAEGREADIAPAPDEAPIAPAPEDPDVARVMVGDFDRASSTISVQAENAPEDTLNMDIRVSVHGEGKTFGAERLLEGSYRNWRGEIRLADLGYEEGTYAISVVAVQANGREIPLGDPIEREIRYQAGGLEAVDEAGTDMEFRMRATDVVVPEGTATWFEVWADDPAQKRIVLGSRTGSEHMGTYRIGEGDVPGTHHAALVMGDMTGMRREISRADFTVRGLTTAVMAFSNVNGHTGDMRLDLGAVAPSGIQGARIAIWTKDDRSDLRELECAWDEERLYATDNISEHGGAYGTYHAEAQVTLGNGMTLPGCTATADIQPVNMITGAARQDDGTVRVTMVGPSPADQGFRLAAWSLAYGQDDVVWYDAALQSDGTVLGIVDPKRHKHSGRFMAHMYAGDTAVAAVEFDVPASDMLLGADQQIWRECQKVYAQVGTDLYANYKWIINNFKYTLPTWNLTPPAGYTREQWRALKGLQTRQGSCYTFAASFAALAKGLGYDAHYVEGYFFGKGNKWYPHGFVLIHMNGSSYICDPELEYISRTPRNMYMQPVSHPRVRYRW